MVAKAGSTFWVPERTGKGLPELHPRPVHCGQLHLAWKHRLRALAVALPADPVQEWRGVPAPPHPAAAPIHAGLRVCGLTFTLR